MTIINSNVWIKALRNSTKLPGTDNIETPLRKLIKKMPGTNDVYHCKYILCVCALACVCHCIFLCDLVYPKQHICMICIRKYFCSCGRESLWSVPDLWSREESRASWIWGHVQLWISGWCLCSLDWWGIQKPSSFRPFHKWCSVASRYINIQNIRFM